MTVFVPFGVTKWTSFLAEKAIGGVIAYGVKLMVMSCLVAIMPDVLNSYAPLMAMNPDNALTVMVALVAVAVLLAFLAWQAPALAVSVMTGGPSLTAGSAAGFGAGVALVAAGATMAAAKGVSAVAGMAGSGGSSSLGSSAAGAASNTANSSEMSSGGNTGDAGTAAGGSSSGSSGGSSGSSPAGSRSSSASSEQSKSPTFSEAMGKMAMARNAIPQEASPQGGMSAPIRD